MRARSIWVLSASILACFIDASAQQLSATNPPSPISPVGRWKTIDDVTGRAKALVVIWEQNEKLYGRVEKLLDPPPEYSDPKCIECSGDLKNRRVVGMRILWDLKKYGDEWSGGKILDPNNGKSYKCRISIEDGGRKLKVRGFIGLSFFGRIQYWIREQ